MTEFKIPDANMAKILEISKMRHISTEEIIEEYTKYYNSKFVQNAAKFKDDAARHNHVIGNVWMNNVSRPQVKPYNIIAFGVGNVINKKNANILAFVTNEEKKTTFSTIVVRESFDIIENIRLGVSYDKIKMSAQIKDGKTTYFADNRAELGQYKAIKQTYTDLFNKVKVKKVTIEEATKTLSKVDESGYTINTDLFYIEGWISRCNTWNKTSGSGCVFNITDLTTKPEMFADESGEVQGVGLSVFAHPRFAIYKQGDKCGFIGSLQKQEGKRIPTMNGFNVIPIEIKDEDDEETVEEYDPDE